MAIDINEKRYWCVWLFTFEKSIKNVANIANRLYKPKNIDWIWRQKGTASILNGIGNFVLDIYARYQTFPKLAKKYEPQRLEKVLR